MAGPRASVVCFVASELASKPNVVVDRPKVSSPSKVVVPVAAILILPLATIKYTPLFPTVIVTKS